MSITAIEPVLRKAIKPFAGASERETDFTGDRRGSETNVFRYAHNNPVNRIDPSGHEATSDQAAAEEQKRAAAENQAAVARQGQQKSQAVPPPISGPTSNGSGGSDWLSNSPLPSPSTFGPLPSEHKPVAPPPSSPTSLPATVTAPFNPAAASPPVGTSINPSGEVAKRKDFGIDPSMSIGPTAPAAPPDPRPQVFGTHGGGGYRNAVEAGEDIPKLEQRIREWKVQYGPHPTKEQQAVLDWMQNDLNTAHDVLNNSITEMEQRTNAEAGAAAGALSMGIVPTMPTPGPTAWGAPISGLPAPVTGGGITPFASGSASGGSPGFVPGPVTGAGAAPDPAPVVDPVPQTPSGGPTISVPEVQPQPQPDAIAKPLSSSAAGGQAESENPIPQQSPTEIEPSKEPEINADNSAHKAVLSKDSLPKPAKTPAPVAVGAGGGGGDAGSTGDAGAPTNGEADAGAPQSSAGSTGNAPKPEVKPVPQEQPAETGTGGEKPAETPKSTDTVKETTQRIAGASDQENAVDELLRNEGREVKPNLQEGQQGAGRQGDRIIDGKPTEIKSISGVKNPNPDSLSGAIANRTMNGRGQADRIIVDTRQQSGMTKEIAERGIARAFGADNKTGGKIQSIRVVGKDFDITVERSGN